MFFYAKLNELNIAVAVAQSNVELHDDSLVRLQSYDPTVLGKRWTGTHWESIPQPEAPQPRHITKRAWRARFTKAERVAIEWASVDRADATLQERQMAAALRSDLKDQEQAVYIDLDDPDVADGLQQLVAFGLIAPHRPGEILSAPIQDSERPT